MSEIIIQADNLSSCEHLFRRDTEVVRVGAYLRVSSRRQKENGFSPEVQLDAIRKELEYKYGADNYILYVFSDIGYSGKLWFRKDGDADRYFRPGLTVLTQAVRKGYLDSVIVYRSDRLCRKRRIWDEIYEDYLRKRGIPLICVAENVDSATPAGKLMIDIFMIHAQRHREQLSEIIRHASQLRRDEGLPLGRSIYGWRLQDKSQLEPGDRPGIEPDLERKTVVLLMKDLFESGESAAGIARELNSRGIASPWGGKWSAQIVKKVLLHHQHCGLVRTKDGGTTRGRHWSLRFFDESEHEKLKCLWETRTAYHSCGERKHRFLDGFVRCRVCGDTLKRTTVRDVLSTYRCRGKGETARHTSYHVDTQTLEKAVLTRIIGLTNGSKFRKAFKKHVAELVSSGDAELRTTQQRLQADVERIQREFYEDAANLAEGTITTEEYAQRRTQQAAQKEATEAQLRSIQKALNSNKIRRKKMSDAMAVLEQLPSHWDRLTRGEQTALLGTLIEDLSVHPVEDGVNMTLKLVMQESEMFVLPRPRPETHKVGGAEQIGLSELTTAYYFTQGYSKNEAAKIRNLGPRTITAHLRRICLQTQAETLEQALVMLAPVLEIRKDELYIGRRVPTAPYEMTNRELKPEEIYLLELVRSGLSHRQVARSLGIDSQREKRWRKAIERLLGAGSILEAIDVAVQRGIIAPRTIGGQVHIGCH